MRGEQAIFNLEIKKNSGLSIDPDIHHSKVFSSDYFIISAVLHLGSNNITRLDSNSVKGSSHNYN